MKRNSLSKIYRFMTWAIPVILVVLFGFAYVSEAQVSGQSLWKLVGGSKLAPVVDTWGIRLPSLTSQNCIGTDGSGNFQAGTCGGGSSGLSTTTPWTGSGVAYRVSDAAVSTVATTTQTFSGPFSITGTLGALVGGANATINWTGLSTTTQPSSSNLLVSNGGAGVYGVATSSVTCTSASGVTCTGFHRVGSGGDTIALSAIPNSSLANSTISGIALGNNLADLTATNGTLTFSGTYNGGTARTIGINLGNANTWTALQTITSASTTNLTVGTFFQIPNSTSQSPTLAGVLGWDTTSGQLKAGNGSATKVIGNGSIYPSFRYATTTAWTGNVTLALGPAFVAETWNSAKCYTNTGTLDVTFNDGTNNMNSFNASTTVGTVGLSTNNTFTASEKRYVTIGNPASSPTEISCTVDKSITAD